MSKIPEIAAACIKNANDLIAAGDKCIHTHLSAAFHLYVLALEEIGKSAILKAIMMAEKRGNDDTIFLKNSLNDHVRKMFWAFWSNSFGSELITREQIEGYRGLASRIHEKRLSSLYTPSDGSQQDLPSLDEVKDFRQLVEARKQIEEASRAIDYTKEKAELIAWFEGLHQNSESRKMVWSRDSQEKLVQLGSVKAWLEWLKEQFDQAAKMSAEITRRELLRPTPNEIEKSKPKWRTRVSFVSESHSIRSKTLKYWNSIFPDSARFSAHEKDSSKIIVELTLTMKTHIVGVFPLLLFYSNRMLLALSVGTLGHFWWYKPPHREKFYEEVEDLETKAKVELERDPPLKVSWPQRALSEEDVNRVLICFVQLPRTQNDPNWKPFECYLQALSLISKTDIHMGFQSTIFQKFVEALCLLATRFEGWDPNEGQSSLLRKVFEETFPDFDELDKYVEFSNAYVERRPSKISIQMDDFMKLKCLLDGYILKHFNLEIGKEAASL